MVSIIIVNYNVKKELFVSIQSLIDSNPKNPYEIIVVDNSEKKDIYQELNKKFPKVVYVPNNNRGFGEGNNVGASHAKGNYLFFLNPDTEIVKGSIDDFIFFLDKNSNVAVVAPLLLDKKGKAYPLQGAKTLTPKRAIFSNSILSKFLPKNRILRDYWNLDWNKKSNKEVDVVPGSAFVIKKKVFREIGGFDTTFFLFFEEFDLFKRIRELNYKLFMIPSVTFKHTWGVSVRKRSDSNVFFKKSRFYYFRKHYGFTSAIIVHLVSNISKTQIVIACILLLSFFLNVYRLPELMEFIGDQAWFYLSARDMLLTGKIPLVGIASSHPWIHQGPLWTYLLGISLWIGNFNPASGALLTAIIGTLSVGIFYFICSKMFSKKTGLIAAILYATSPLVIINSRFAYHTSFISVCVMLFFFFLSQWTLGKKKYLPFILLALAFLYNFELATIPFFAVFFLISLFGLYKKKDWFLSSLNKRTLTISMLAFILPMLPVLIYDFTHGFSQTLKFALWIAYAPFKAIIINSASTSNSHFLQFLVNFINNLIFAPNVIISLSIFFVSLVVFLIGFLKKPYKAKQNRYILLILLIFTFGSLLLSRTPSDAYLPMLFPLVIHVMALAFGKLSRYPLIILISTIFIGNSTVLLSNNYDLPTRQTVKLTERYGAVDRIIMLAKKKEYNLIGDGTLSLFPSFIMNYEYLAWLRGNAPVKKKVPLQIHIEEKAEGILVTEKILHE